uniref:Uncharacterized protein n=1 Tax=Anopheles culicifacies TaxID=139723 RepID=A0A182MGB8_9DIPT
MAAHVRTDRVWFGTPEMHPCKTINNNQETATSINSRSANWLAMCAPNSEPRQLQRLVVVGKGVDLAYHHRTDTTRPAGHGYQSTVIIFIYHVGLVWAAAFGCTLRGVRNARPRREP